jgi:hypothetical protein
MIERNPNKGSARIRNPANLARCEKPAWDFEFDLRRRADGAVAIQILDTSEDWS